MSNWWERRSVWVSGATGSWGREFCKQLLTYNINKLVCYGRGDHRLALLEKELNDERVRVHVGDVRDEMTVARSIPPESIVIHLAALKRVEGGFFSPFEMESVNVQGTRAVISACLSRKAHICYYLSSDKAAMPTTFYGATKFLAEQLWLGASVYSPYPKPPYFIAGRSGNALGSTGSVLEVWKGQFERGEPLTIYDPEATRFVLVIQHAVERILEKEIPSAPKTQHLLYTPLPPAVKILTLAKAMVGEEYPLNILGQGRGLGEKKHEVMEAGGVTSKYALRLSLAEMRKILHAIGYDYASCGGLPI